MTSTTALITGANRGLGRAVAEELSRRGVSVIVGARNAADGADTAAYIGNNATSIQLDVCDPASIGAAAAELERTNDGIDILVNNAGILPEATQQSTDVVDVAMFQQTYATNVFGPVAVVQAFLPQLKRSAHGRIVNVSSTMGSLADQTNPGSPFYGMVVPAYQSSKAALNNLTIALSKALAGTSIKVTSVCPGFVQTDLTPVNRSQAPLTADQAATVVADAALLADDAPSGTFLGQQGIVPW